MLGNIKTFTNRIRWFFLLLFFILKKSSVTRNSLDEKNYKKWMFSFKIIRAFKIPIWPNATDA